MNSRPEALLFVDGWFGPGLGVPCAAIFIHRAMSAGRSVSSSTWENDGSWDIHAHL